MDWTIIKRTVLDLGSIAGLLVFAFTILRYISEYKQKIKIEFAPEHGNPMELVYSRQLQEFPGVIKNCLLLRLRIKNPNKIPIVLKQLILQVDKMSSNVYIPTAANTATFQGQYFYPLVKDNQDISVSVDRDRYFTADMKLTPYDTKILTSLFLIRQDDIAKRGSFKFKVIALDSNNKAHVNWLKFK